MEGVVIYMEGVVKTSTATLTYYSTVKPLYKGHTWGKSLDSCK